MIAVYRKRHEDLLYFKMERGLVACTDIDGLMQTPNISPLPLLFKALLEGQKNRVFFSRHLNLRTAPETGLPSTVKIITIKFKSYS